MIKKAAVASLLALTLVVAVGALSASAGTKRSAHGEPATLVGTWDVTVSVVGQPPFRTLATFERGGTTVETPAALGTLRGSAHGAWKRIGHRLYAMTRMFFRFEGGVYAGTTKVNATIRVARDGETLETVSISEMRDPAGNLIRGGIRATATGTRINVEEIPDRP
jgi:hypothetical protein